MSVFRVLFSSQEESLTVSLPDTVFLFGRKESPSRWNRTATPFDRKGRHSGGRFAGLATKGQRHRFRNLSHPDI